MQKGQIALGVGTIILALALYFGGKTVVKKEQTATVSTGSFSFEQYEEQQTAKLLPAEKSQLAAITEALKAVKPADTATFKKLYLQTSDFWKNLNNPALGAYYFYQFAKVEGTKVAMENAGDVLVSAYKSTEDSVILNNLITFALRSYEDAVLKDGNDVDLKIKLADAYVQGSQEPMKGIGILRQLSDSLPDNVPVLLALGRLSIQSGQYDKAKERLQKILQLEPQNTEALYFLAITEAQLGHDDEAIRLFEMCKLLVNNIEFNKEIDEIVKNLKSKKV
ncbi:MAG: tetratricopeptide repeat protein [Sphingobacteriales bacterium]|nr:tetratricopeptide repeat protein [Sphingobacteriales bacterium]HPH87380.1 tetratricopeptide repeat protein [Chitinophagales bacterium]